MFTIILMNKVDREPLRKVYAVDNGYLSREEKEDSSKYPLLSEVSKVDICVFDSADMSNLIVELKSLSSTLNNEDKEHIAKIIELAKVCKQNDQYIIGVTPFSNFLNESEIKLLSNK